MQPTRARGSDDPHILDLILTNDDFLEDILYYSPIGKSDHSVIVFKCNLSATRAVNTDKFNYSKGDYDSFRLFMDRDWSDAFIKCGENVNCIWNEFKTIFFDGLNKYVPKINSNHWKKKPTWHRPISKSVKKLINRKHRLWRRFQETKCPKIETVFKSVRNKVRKESRKLQKIEEQKIAISCSSNPKRFWQFVKSKTNNHSNIGNIHMKDTDGQRILSEDADKCSAFVNYFSKIYTNEPDDFMNILPHIMPPNSSGEVDITEEVIYEKLASLKTDKSPGPDNIHPRVIHELKFQLCTAFEILFKLSLKVGQLPDEWKSSVVSVLHKKGDKKIISNYRTISLTCIVCKIMESIIRDKIMEYFINNSLFSSKQFGFIKGRSTTLQLLNIIDK